MELFRVEISKVQLSPTDILVIHLDGPCSNDTVKEIRESIASYLPLGQKCLVLRDRTRLSVLSPSEAD